MKRLEVGKLFKEGKTKYQEGVTFDFDNSGGHLLIKLSNPSKSETSEVKKGKLSIGLCTYKDIVLLLYKFGSLEWMDVPYSIHLSDEYRFCDSCNNKGFANYIYLIDANTGILKAMRLVSWNTKFSNVFQKEVEAQKLIDFNAKSYDANLKTLYANYSTKDLIGRLQIKMIVGDNENE